MPNDPVPGPQTLATLAISAGPRSGEALSVARAVTRIGRGSQNDLVLDDDSVSTLHARLEYDLAGWRLTDLDSANGTYVDDVRLTAQVPTPLHPGAAVRFGAVRTDFEPVEGVDAEAAMVEAAAAEPTPAVSRARFRLPVWVALLILVLIALAVYFYREVEGTDDPAEPIPAPAPTTVWLDVGPAAPA